MKIKSLLLSMMCISSACLSSFVEATYAANPQIGIDNSGQIAGVWVALNEQFSQYCIQGSAGTTFPAKITTITDPSRYFVRDPIIAFPESNKATTYAVATWLARDLATGTQLIQATILTSLGWNNSPSTLSRNDGSEQPNQDYQVSISENGSYIAVVWSSLIPSTGNTVLRSAISNNGGVTWTTSK